MKVVARFLAVDLGAASGRVMVCAWTGEKFAVSELHRFSNGPVLVGGEFCWDAPKLWRHLLDGLTKYRSRYFDHPFGIAVDAWGVDFALLDRFGELIANPTCYRDLRTNGVANRVFELVSESEWYFETGTKTMPINTLFQLYSMVEKDDPRLSAAAKLVMIPDLFLHLLCGEAGAEFTEATTTQMYSLHRRSWATQLLKRTGISDGILPPVASAGTILGPIRKGVLEQCGLGSAFPVISVASHDTASAVAAIPEMDNSSVFISCGTWSLVGVQEKDPNMTSRAMNLGFSNEGSAEGGFLLVKNLAGLWILQECMRIWAVRGEQLEWDAVCRAAVAAPQLRAFFDSDDPRLRTLGEMPEAIQACVSEMGQMAPQSVGEIARVALESLTLKYREVIQSLEELTGRRLTTIRMVGGGCMNQLLCQMTADATGRLVVAGPVEAAALGNAMLQAVATGELKGLSDGRAAIASSVERATYVPQQNDAWDEAFSRFRRLEMH